MNKISLARAASLALAVSVAWAFGSRIGDVFDAYVNAMHIVPWLSGQ